MPRILFPGKAIIDESQQTNRYTGLRHADMSEGTQISLGYAAESYVDFGRQGMMVVIFGLGVLLGGIYRWCLKNSKAKGILGFGLACTVLSPAMLFESSSAKIIGGIFAAMLAAWFVTSFVVPRLAPWLLEQCVAPTAPERAGRLRRLR